MKNNSFPQVQQECYMIVKIKHIGIPAILILILLLIFGKSWGQSTIAQFTFEDVLTPIVDNVVGTPSFTSSGVGSLNFNATTPCEGTKMYQGSFWTPGDYYQFTVNTTGYSALSLSYCERGSNVLIGTFQVRVSPDGTNWTTVLADYTPPLANTTQTTAVFPLSCENAATVFIQIYKTSAPTSTGQSLRVDNAILTGTLETIPPVATFNPANGETGVLINAKPTITFNEPVQNTNGTTITNGELTSLVIFKTINASGTDVPFTATIDATGKIITITPSGMLNFTQLYYLAVGAVEDVTGNESGTQSATFTTMANTTSNDATLSDLKADGTTVAGFASTIYAYTVELPYGTAIVPTVTATPAFGLATVSVTPAASLPGTTNVLVTAQDGTTQITYTVSFTLAAPSTDASLSSLKWVPFGGSQSVLVTGFNSAALNYSVEIPAEISTVTLNGTTSYGAASIAVTNPSALAGTQSQRTGTIVVTAQDGITTQTYTIVFTITSGAAFHFKEGLTTFPPANWSYTGNISSSTANGVGIFDPAVSCPKFKWTAPTDGGILVSPSCNTTGILTFYIRVLDNNPASQLHMYIEKSTDGGTNWTILSTDPMPVTGSTTLWHQVIIPVNDNSSNVILRLRGTAITGTTSQGLFYVDDISLTMNSTADASLSDLKVNGTTITGFSPSIFTYNMIMPAETTTVPVVAATTAQVAATVFITNASALPGTTTILVTAPNGITTSTYTINFSEELSAPVSLAANTITPGQVNLIWSDSNTDESGFRIERKPDNGLYALVGEVGSNVTTYSNTIPGLVPNDFVPADRFPSVTVTSGVKFADVTNYKGVPTSLYLDVYEPTSDNTLGRPVIIWIHGGGFRTDSYRTQGYIVDYSTRFAKRGYVCISIDYRLRASADMPTQLSEFPALQDAARDANAAISWIKANAALYHIDPNLIFIAGGSAGGRTTQTVCQFDGPDPTALYSPENIYLATPWNKTSLVANATLWGGLEPEMRGWVYPSPPYSTANYLQSTDVPTILVHGDADVTILPQNSIDLNNALIAAGITSELHIIPGATHSCLGKETEISAWVASFFAQEWNKVNARPKSYTYRVSAYNSISNSAYSNEAISAPAAPGNLVASVISSSQINLSWTDNAGTETGFRIESKTGAGPFTDIASVGPNVTIYNNTGLTPSTPYTYRVLAFNASGNSAYSNEAAGTTQSSDITSYYVDVTGGNDANNGLSASTAWKSLTKVNATTFAANNQILFKAGGVWTGRLYPKGSGSAGRPIIIDMYGTGNKPLIDGNGMTGTGVVYLYNQQYWEINNLEITNDAASEGDRRGVRIEAENYGTANHIYLKNLNIHNIRGSVGQNRSDKRTGGIGFGIVDVAVQETHFNDILVENCVITSCDNQGIITECVTDDGFDPYSPEWNSMKITNAVIRNNTISNISKNAMIIRLFEGGVIENNVCSNTANGISGNTIFSAACTGTVFQYNEGYDNNSPDADGSLYDADLRSPNTYWQYSYSHDNAHGLFWSCTVQADVNVVCRYNISQNDQGIIFCVNYPVTSMYIYNNTVYIPSNLSPQIISERNTGSGTRTYTFNNNLIYNLSSTASYDWTSAYNRSIDYNCFYGIHPPTEPADAHKVTTDPKLVNPGSGGNGITSLNGYKLQAGSSCINKGKTIPNNGGKDYWGNALYNGAADIGANEYSQTTTTYIWQGASSGDWTVASNWNPARTTPAANDILKFNSGSARTVTNVPSQTIGQLAVSNNTTVELQSATPITLTISGDTGVDFDVQSGCVLNISQATNAISVALSSGATGSVGGAITCGNAAHRLTTADAAGITFQNGSVFTAGTGFSGNAFGITNLNSVVFAGGSKYIYYAGANPFGAVVPNSVVVWQTGSSYVHRSTASPDLVNRTYADFELDQASGATFTTPSPVTFDNLIVSTGTWTLGVKANFTIKKDITVTPGATLNLSPTTVGTIIFDAASAHFVNGGSVTFGAFQNVTANNNLSFVTGNFTLASGASLITYGTVSGNVTVIRPIVANEWHLISAPVSNAVSGLFTGKYLQTFTESTQAYTDITSIIDPLTPMKGFALYDAAGLTASFAGKLNTGAQSIGVTKSSDGWNLVGNPYPSSIDWDAASGWTKTNVNAAIYIHVNSAIWASYVSGIGANGGSKFIAPCQGFFVQATSAGTLALDNAVRVHNATPFYKSNETVSNLVRLEVSGNNYTDESVVRFLPEATANFDGNYDAYKFYGDVAEAAQLYTLGSTPLAINTLPEATTVPVGVRARANGTYTIAAIEIRDVPVVALEDTKTGIFTNLKNESYTFNMVAGENEQRFVLHFGTTSVTENGKAVLNIYSYQKTVFISLKEQAKGDIFIYTIAGQLVTTKTSARGMNEIKLPNTGNYIVKVVTKDNTVVSKVFIQ